MSYYDLINSPKFQAFLSENELAMPSNTNLDNQFRLRIKDCTKRSSDSVMLTYYDEVRANDGKEFIRVHWFNGRRDDAFFTPDSPNRVMTEEEKKEQRIKLEKQQQERERANKESRDKAYQEYLACGVPCKFHDYLKVKNVHAYYGVKVATQTFSEPDEENIIRFRIRKGELIIPVVNLKKSFMTYQRITRQGKKFMAGKTPKRGGIYPIGLWMFNNTKRVILCEGYATGATIYEATGDVVLVCFDIGNIRAVCEQLRAEYPDVEVILASDFDVSTSDQAGLINGLKLAQQFALKFIFPTPAQNGSDWNDLYHEKGMAVVADTIKAQLMNFDNHSVDSVIMQFAHYLNEKNNEKLIEAA